MLASEPKWNKKKVQGPPSNAHGRYLVTATRLQRVFLVLGRTIHEVLWRCCLGTGCRGFATGRHSLDKIDVSLGLVDLHSDGISPNPVLLVAQKAGERLIPSRSVSAWYSLFVKLRSRETKEFLELFRLLKDFTFIVLVLRTTSRRFIEAARPSCNP